MQSISFRIPFALVVVGFSLACEGAQPDRSPHRLSQPTDASSGASDPEDFGRGEISYYSDALAGRLTANGERYDPQALTCAHRTLPFQTSIAIVIPETGKTARCRVNDRGPYAKGRILDVSRAVATKLDLLARGHAIAELRGTLPRDAKPPAAPPE